MKDGGWLAVGLQTLFRWVGWLFGGLILISMAGGGVRLISGGDVNGEREGEIKWDDCREKLWHDERPFSELLSIYTCHYDRNAGRRIIGGVCARLDYPYFSNGCRTANLYFRQSDIKCSAGFWADPLATGCVKEDSHE